MSKDFYAEYFENGEKVSLSFLKEERYKHSIFEMYSFLFKELKKSLYIPGSFACSSFIMGSSIFSVIVYYKKGCVIYVED